MLYSFKLCRDSKTLTYIYISVHIFAQHDAGADVVDSDFCQVEVASLFRRFKEKL